MEAINFKVIGIKKAEFKAGHAVVEIKFDGNEKVYTYVRKMYNEKDNESSVIVAGCKIFFNGEFTVTNIERVYEFKGRKRTVGSKTSVADKIRKEIEKLPEVKEEKSSETKTEEVEETEEIKVSFKEIKEEEPKEEVKEEPKKAKVIHHEKYDEIKTCLECNIPVYLAGPAGSGKNHTVEQIAKEMGWNFYFSNSVQQEYKLTGFIDAGGKFHETEFYKACMDEKDCIFFLDEMDASIPEVLVLLNAAIANGYFEFPNGRVNLEHVHFVAAGNTVGSGADEMYTGRMVLDQATLDRFAIIEFDYSREVEEHLAKGNTELVNFVENIRKQANENGVRATFSYRCITMVTKLEKAGMKLENILKIAVFKGLDSDTINTFTFSGYGKYETAARKLRK